MGKLGRLSSLFGFHEAVFFVPDVAKASPLFIQSTNIIAWPRAII
jgi:hypothetical protein